MAEDPSSSPAGQQGRAGAVQKGGLAGAPSTIAQAHPGAELQPWCQDEARVGQKDRTCHRWWLKGQRPPGLCDRRFTWTYVFADIQPATGESTALVLPEVSTEAMSLLLARFSAKVDAGVGR